MADSSFDLVSDFDQQELVNALDQVRREVATRYDFKGAHVNLELPRPRSCCRPTTNTAPTPSRT